MFERAILSTTRSASRVALVRPLKLIWAPVLIALLGFTAACGTAHPLATYRYHGDYDHKVYDRCDYVGRHPHSTYPGDGRCPWVVFTNSGEN